MRRASSIAFTLSLALALSGALASGAQETAPGSQRPSVLTARDTLRLQGVGGRLGGPRLSPDGQWVVYTVTARDMDADDLGRTTQVWRVRVGGEEARQLTRGEESATAPAWFPEGDRIAFLRPVDDKRQVFVLRTDGGEAWQMTEHEEGIQSFRIAPDGSHLLFTARDPDSEERTRRKKDKDDAVVVDAEYTWSHLWLHDVKTAESRRLTAGDFTVSDPRWSPNARTIAYVTRPTTKNDDGWDSDVWTIDSVTGERSKLYENPGPDAAPRWSPDGETIAFVANPHATTTTWYNKLYLVPAAGGEPQILLEDFDLNVGAPIWAPNGADIYWSTGERTRTNLFSVQVSTGEWLAHDAPRGRNSQFELSADGGRWVWVHTAPTWPAELFTAPAGDLSAPRRLSDHNDWIRDDGLRLADVRAITWTNSDGQTIEGVVHLPPGFAEGQRHPLVVNPHGGPSGAVLTSFNSTNQFLAGNGFVVLQPNFRGSSNYGQEFLNANRNYWGIRDYDDIMTGVDALIELGWADPDRMVAYGWSYGGYMTFWMSTQTDRFKVISPGAGLSNLYSMYSTTDIPNYLGWFFGTPWDNEDIYRQLSPIRHVKNVTAKILIMHGASDARVPPEQAVEFYRALRDLGKDVTYVSYPRQPHGIREPRLQVDRLMRYLCTFSAAVALEPVGDSCDAAGDEDVAGGGAGSGDDGSGGVASDAGLGPAIFEIDERQR